jgi:hypothetical protein
MVAATRHRSDENDAFGITQTKGRKDAGGAEIDGRSNVAWDGSCLGYRDGPEGLVHRQFLRFFD